ncbi:MAG: biotin/lipoate A/B protein ligase family protein [Deltaproteobacteria bacterium]|nr:biotin/lipoate A/B protein ligase family protein [Deltaproteobacteria bacterium]
MAVDEALFREAVRKESPPTLRFYGWQKPTVSLGHFQDARREIDIEACRRFDIDIVRRLTGGKAVLHEQEVTYAVVAADDSPLFPPDILGTYRLISACIAQGLSAIGIAAEMASEGRAKTEGTASAACFAHPSRYELLVAGRKICGSAQRRSPGVFLQHGALLMTFDPRRTSAVLMPPFHSQGRREDLQKTVTSVGEHAPSVDEETLCRVLQEGFRQVLGVRFVEGSLTPAEEDLKKELLKKYESDRWNLEGRKSWNSEL